MVSVQFNPPCHYSGKPQYPDKLAWSYKCWDRVYKNPRAFAYSKHNIDLMIDYGVVNPDGIGDLKTHPIQRSHRFCNLAFAGAFSGTSENRKLFPREEFYNHPKVMEGYDTLCKLRENDFGKQDPAVYARLLETNSIGLIIRPIEVVQFLMPPLVVKGDLPMPVQVTRKDLASLPPCFHMGSEVSKDANYNRIARVAHLFYGPLMEFYGYTNTKSLAGDLDQLSYYYRNRRLYDKVKSCLATMRSRVNFTTEIMKTVISQLGNLLREEGYAFDILPRDRKHPGRVMEKVNRKLKENGSSVEDCVFALKDLAAFTVVLHTYRDEPVVEIKHFQKTARIIDALVSGLQAVRDSGGLEATETNYMSDHGNPKKNGYEAYHLDMVFANFVDNSLLTGGMEAIIMNTHQYWMAREGGPAHYLYKGSGLGFEAIQDAYRKVKEIILRNLQD
jgi:hypothetical protein